MKNVWMAVLLIAAAGTGVYFLFFNKKKPGGETSFQKEWVIGKWKIDSLTTRSDSAKNSLAALLFTMDSNARRQIYNFQSNGQIFVSLPGDTLAKQDTSSFTWGPANEFLWKEKTGDTKADSLTVVKLNKDDFVLQSKDSVLVYFRKLN